MNYEAIVKTAEAGRLHEIDFRDKSIANGFDLGRLFEQQFGSELFKFGRSHNSFTMNQVAEAAGAMSMAHFSNITGQIVFSRILEAYEAEEFKFTKMIPTFQTPFQDGEKVPGFTSLASSAQEIGEGKPYPILGISENFIQTPACTKRGCQVAVTREAIFGDRTGELMSRTAPAAGEALGIEREENAVDAVIDENQTRHRYNWKNLGPAATYQTSTPYVNDSTSTPLVDESSINTLKKLMNGILDPFTSKPIRILPRQLIFSSDLEFTAMRILNATNVRTGNYATTGTPLIMDAPKVFSLEPVTSLYMKPRLATDTHWFIGDIPKAVNYMENWPLKIEQAPAGHALDFNNDIPFVVKASRKGEYVVVEPRALCRGQA